MNLRICNVKGCKNRSDLNKNVKFYSIPRNYPNRKASIQINSLFFSRREAWIKKLNLNACEKKLIHVCGKHFITGSFYFK